MTGNPRANDATERRLRLGMVGGGPGAFIGAVHRIAARLDDRFELVAAALSSDPARSRAAALDLHVAPERAYGSFTEMATAEAQRPDRIDAVSIVTPNHVHFQPAKAFLEAGIHVICDKPLTTTVEDALALAEIVRRSGLIFGLTHNYTGYPLVRQAREMVLAGELGRIRVVQVEYAQDWLTTPVEATGHKQAVWRTDPAQSGPAGSLGDCSCDLRAVREECCGRARWLQETRTTFGCGFMEKRRDSSGGRKIRTICVLRRMASRRLPSVAPGPRPRRRRSMPAASRPGIRRDT